MEGLYNHNKRRLSMVPISVENVLRKAVYGGLGAAVGSLTKPQYLFVLGHMRAGSSLLTQILASHPHILGYGELHLSYTGPQDFRAMLGKVAWVTRSAPTTRYVMDKVLHDWLLESQDVELLTRDDVRVIFLVRGPRSTLQSLVRSFGMALDEAYEYYVGRLHTLAEQARTLGPRRDCILVSYEDLVERTGDALRLMQRYLELETELRQDYRPTASARGVDPSANLKAGRILTDEHKVVRHTTELPDAILQGAQTAYEECNAAIERHCRSLVGAEGDSHLQRTSGAQGKRALA